jgi:hypothetical protein
MPASKRKLQLKKLADAKVAKVAKEEQAQSSHNALFNPGKAAPPPARKDSQPSKKARLGRPSGSRDSEQRTRRTDDGATVAEGQRLAEDGKRVRVARTFYVSEAGGRDWSAEDLRSNLSQGREESRRLSTDIEVKLKGIALDDASAIAEFAMLLLSPASGSGDSIDSAVSKFCESDSQAAEIEDLRCQLRAKDDLLAQRTDQIMELEAKLDYGQLGAITTRYPPRDIYMSAPPLSN